MFERLFAKWFAPRSIRQQEPFRRLLVERLEDRVMLSTVSFSAGTFITPNPMGSVSFLVQLDAASSQTVAIDYATSDGTATAGTDYTAGSGTLTFAPGTTTQTFSIAVISNANTNPKTFYVALSNPVNATIGTYGTAVEVLYAPAVQLSASTYDAYDTDGSATITAVLSAASPEAVTVDYTASGGSAIPGTDYTPTSGTLTFAPYQTSQSFSVPVLTDGVSDSGETVNLGLSSPVGAYLGSPTLSLLNLHDAPTVQFSSSSYSASDLDASATITVTVSSPSTQTVSVGYYTTDGTATANFDYTSKLGTLRFTPGQTSKTFDIPLLGDDLPDGPQTIFTWLADPSGVTLGSTPAATLTLDDAPTVRFSDSEYLAGDSGVNAVITVALRAPSSQQVTVNYAASQGSAIAGTDFTPVSGTLTFSPGETARTFAVPVLNDGADDGNETVQLTLSGATNAVIGDGGGGGALLTLHDYPTVDFSTPSYTVLDSSGRAVITLSLSVPSTQPITVDYATGGGMAMPGTDYVSASGTVMFNPGETSKSFTIWLLNDGFMDGDETVDLALSDPTNAVIGGTGSAVLTLQDLPTVDFSASTYTALDTESAATITATLSAPSTQIITVDFATNHGTATPGTDYTTVAGTLTFAPGEASASFAVPLLNDGASDGNETVNLGLSNAVGANLGNSNATLFLQDPPAVEFSAPTFSANDGDGTATILVSLSGPSTQPITVNYATSNGTATAGVDYTAVNDTLTFNPGDTVASFTIPLLRDPALDGNETINLALSSATNAVISNTSSAVLTLHDDPVINFSSATYSVYDTSGTATITVTLSAVSPVPVSVDYFTSDEGATSNLDYLGQSGTLTFNPGQTSQTFIIPVYDDGLTDGAETVDLGLSAATDAVIGTTGTAILTLEDYPTVQFAATSSTLVDTAGSAAVTVTLSAACAQTVTVDYATSDGSAIAGTDYTATSGTLTFNHGQTTQTLTVPILNDGANDGDETLNLALSGVTNAALGDANTAILTLQDQPTVSFTDPAYSAYDTDAGATVTVVLSAAPTQTVTVNYATSDGTATAGTDYTATSGTLTFAAGQTRKTFSVPILHDSSSDGNETVHLTLSSPVNAALAGSSSVVMTLKDAPNVEFSAPSFTAADGDGVGVITVDLSTPSSEVVTVDYATSNGSATAGRDYLAQSGTLVFYPFQTEKTLEIQLLNDGVSDSDETVTLSLRNPVAALLGTNAGATLTLQEQAYTPGSRVSVQFSANTYNAHDADATATITAILSGPSSQPVTVRYATSDGSATSGVDYTATSGTLTFAPGTVSATFTVTLHNDGASDGTQTVNLALTNPHGVTLGSRRTAVLDLDDSYAPGQSGPTFQFSSATYTATDNDGSKQITVTLSPPQLFATSVEFSTSDGTATSIADYFANSGTLTFPPYATSETFTVSLRNDTSSDGHDYLNLALSNPSAGTTLGQQASAQLILSDPTSNGPTVQFSSPSFSAADTDGQATIYVTLSAPSSHQVTVDYATTSGGTASPNVDYTYTSGTLSFSPNQTIRSFTVPVLYDHKADGMETVNLALSNAYGATLGSNSTAVLDLLDPCNIQFDAATYSAYDTDIDASGNVVLSSPSNQTVTVTFATTSGGSAVPGVDYTPNNYTITFNPGQTSQRFSVYLKNDNAVDGTETINLALSNPSGAVLGSQSSAVIDMQDVPIVNFLPTGYSANDTDGSTLISVQLSAPSPKQVTVQYATSDGTASSTVDYYSASGTLTFQPGQTSATFPIGLRGDMATDGTDTVNLTLSNPVNATLGPNSKSVLNLHDAPTVQFSAASYNALDSDASATITVTLSAGSAQNVLVNYATSDGTATAGKDYTSRSNTLTFTPGQLTQTFTVPLLGDTSADGTETVNLTLSNPVGAVLGSQSTAVLNVSDPLRSVYFSAAKYNAHDTDASAQITVSLSAPCSQSVSVHYATSDGTAYSGIDYTTTQGYLTFTPGQTTQTFTVPIINDGSVDGTETANLTLSNPQGCVLGSPATAVLNLADAPTVQFSASTYNAYDTDGSATITVTLSASSSQTVSVQYATVHGSASPGVDYNDTSGTLTFTPGQISQTFTVGLIDDHASDGTETVNLNLTNPVGCSIGTPATAILNLKDPPNVQFSASTHTALDNDSAAVFLVTLSTASTEYVMVDYATSDGTATAGVDYYQSSGTITFSPGQTSYVLHVGLIGDTAADGMETFTVTLSNPQSARLGSPATAVLDLYDYTPPPTIQFNSPTFTAHDNDGTVTITVTLSAASSQFVSVQYATSNGTATAGVDYSSASGPLTFFPGQTSQSFTITLLGDTASDGMETFNLTLSNPVNATLGSNSSGTVNLYDPLPTVQFSASTYSGYDNDPGVLITVTLSAPYSLGVHVDYATGNGTATGGVDYTPISGTLLFPAYQTSEVFIVHLLGDTTPDGTETVPLTLSNPVNAILGNPSSATLDINDPPTTVQFSAPSYSTYDTLVYETVTVTLSLASSQTITVDYATSDGTATNGTDYTSTSGMLTFSPGQTTQTFAVQLLGDPAIDGTETAFLLLSNPTGATLGNPSTAVLDINDVPVVQFAASTYNTTDMSGSAPILVTLSAPFSGNVTVNYLTTDGTATAGTDYTTTSGTLTFAPGQTAQSFSVPLLGDPAADRTETVNLWLNSPVNATLGTYSAVLDIKDAPATVEFSAPIYNAYDTDPSATITVVVWPASTQSVTVDYTTNDGSATQGVDYVATGGTLTFAPGQTSATFTVPLLDDHTSDGTQSVDLALSNPTGATLGTYSSAELDLSDLPPTVSFIQGTDQANEGDVLFYTVGLSYAINSNVDVPLTYAGTAMNGYDYSGPQSVTILGGSTYAIFKVPTYIDNEGLGDETVIPTLNTPSNATLGSPTTYTTIVHELPTVNLGMDQEGPEGNAYLLTLTLSAASIEDVVVNLSYAGTATSPEDYQAGGQVTIPAGQTAAYVTVYTNIDNTSDTDSLPNHTVIASITSVSGALMGSSTTATVTIDEPTTGPVVYFDVTPVSGPAGSNLALTVKLSQACSQEVDVPVYYYGNAVAGVDYATPPAQVVFPPGQRSVQIPINSMVNLDEEGDRQVIASLGQPANAVLGLDSVHMALIRDPHPGAAPQILRVSPDTGTHVVDPNNRFTTAHDLVLYGTSPPNQRVQVTWDNDPNGRYAGG
jgi:hypothetical protein